jgi:hypothetical protein
MDYCSDLPMDRYHALSDATMTTLLERLEELLDRIGSDKFEVDYHVSLHNDHPGHTVSIERNKGKRSVERCALD